MHQVAERRAQHRPGAPHEFGDPDFQAAQIAIFPVELIAGRNGPTGGPKIDRPSPGATTPPPHLFRRSKGRCGFVQMGPQALAAMGTLCGRAAPLDRFAPLEIQLA
jgi:hypothetical protein